MENRVLARKINSIYRAGDRSPGKSQYWMEGYSKTSSGKFLKHSKQNFFTKEEKKQGVLWDNLQMEKRMRNT